MSSCVLKQRELLGFKQIIFFPFNASHSSIITSWERAAENKTEGVLMLTLYCSIDPT
jgi:hypothetical protein